MKWYNRTPVTTPAMKATTVAVATAIPTAALVVRDSTAPAENDSFCCDKIYNFHVANNRF